jgi:phage-related protein
MKVPTKIVRWIGSSRRDLQALPKTARRIIGNGLWDAQEGRISRYAKALHGFGGASVLEIRAAHEGNAFRAAYTVRFREFVYVLHVFQKKSHKGSTTPADTMELIRKRLKKAEEQYEEWKANHGHRD